MLPDSRELATVRAHHAKLIDLRDATLNKQSTARTKRRTLPSLRRSKSVKPTTYSKDIRRCGFSQAPCLRRSVTRSMSERQINLDGQATHLFVGFGCAGSCPSCGVLTLQGIGSSDGCIFCRKGRKDTNSTTWEAQNGEVEYEASSWTLEDDLHIKTLSFFASVDIVRF